MATITRTTTPEAEGDQCVVMRGVGWAGYTTLLRLRGERPRPKMVYLDGNVFLMTTSFTHEHLKERLGHLVMAVVVELDIPCIMAGQTTFRRKKKRGGVEGDETYYLANLEPIRAKAGRENINLRHDPPPDLAVEVDFTHDTDAAVEVYRRFGVPEVWVCEIEALHILALQPNGRYAETPNSVAFPFLTAAEVFGWVSWPQTGSDTDWVKELRRWVRETLLPRARGARGGA
jgi:Uma2 family endonuclease